MERTVHVQRCQVSAPMAGHQAGLFTERKVQQFMAGIPNLGTETGRRGSGGPEKANRNHPERM